MWHDKEMIRFWWPWPILKVTGWLKLFENGFLHIFSRMNGWILTKLVQLYCWDRDKNWLDFGDLDHIFKVTGGLRLLEIGLSVPYLMKEWVDFDQICTTILLWHEKELIRVWWPWPHFQGHTMAWQWGPWPHFQGHRRAQIVGKCLVCTLSHEGIGGFWSNLHNYIDVTWKRTD